MQIDELRDGLKQRMQEKLDNQGYSTATVDEAADASRKMDALASKLKGDEALIVKAAAAATKGMLSAGVRKGEALTKFMEAGAVDPATLKSRNDIDERLKLNGEVVKTNEDLRKALQEAPGVYRKFLIEGSIQPERADAYLKGFERGAKFPTLLKVCDAHDEFAKAAAAYLTILRDQWGKWTMEKGGVTFSDDSALEDFNKAVERLAKAGAAQDELMDALGYQSKGQAPSGSDK